MGRLCFSPYGKVQVEVQVEGSELDKKEWDKTVTSATKEASEQNREKEAARREDLGEYGEKQKELFLAANRKMGTVKYIRELIKERME